MALLGNFQGVQGLQGGMSLKARIVAILLFIGLAFFLSGCDGSDSTSGEEIIPWEGFDPSTINTADWMRKLPDSTKLNEIVLPGSHDAGMSVLTDCTQIPVKHWDHVAEFMSQTQSVPIDVQLLLGTRYFDLRVDYNPKKNKLTTYHRTDVWHWKGVGCDGEEIPWILYKTRQFLLLHPSEFVILEFSHFRDDGGDHNAENTKSLLSHVLYACKDWLYQLPVNYPLDEHLVHHPISEMRGKIVAVADNFGYRINPYDGRFSYADRTDVYWSAANLAVYDKYSETADYKKMKADQLNKLALFGGFGRDYLFLLSWTLTPNAKLQHVSVLAEEANSKLPFVLYYDIPAYGWPFPNIVFIDYVNMTTNQWIIQCNEDVRTR
jgi:hypothetical protein